MKVKELIEELKKFNPEADIKVWVDRTLRDIYFKWSSNDPNDHDCTIAESKKLATEVVIEPGEAKPQTMSSGDIIAGSYDDACDSDLASEYSKPASSKEFSADSYLKS